MCKSSSVEVISPEEIFAKINQIKADCITAGDWKTAFEWIEDVLRDVAGDLRDLQCNVVDTLGVEALERLTFGEDYADEKLFHLALENCRTDEDREKLYREKITRDMKADLDAETRMESIRQLLDSLRSIRQNKPDAIQEDLIDRWVDALECVVPGGADE